MIQNKLLNFLWLHRFALTLLLLLPAMFISQGCVKRTFEERAVNDGNIEIELKWDVNDTPTPLSFAFYRVADGLSLSKVVDGSAQGYTGTLPAGEYKVIAYDKSAQLVDFRYMENYSTAEVFAQVKEGTKSTRGTLISEPGAVFSAGGCVEMPTLVVVSDQTLKAVALPVNRTRTMKLKFEITNGASVTSIYGVMNGVSPSVILCTGEASNLSANISFHADQDANGLFETSASLFGFVTPEVGASNINTIDVTINRGDQGKHDVPIDLTETIKNIIIDNGGVIPIEIPVKIEINMIDLDNITATVKPWDDSGTGGGDLERPKR